MGARRGFAAGQGSSTSLRLGEGRQRIKAHAEAVGLTQRQGRDEKIGLAFAVLGGAGALLALVVLAVPGLLDRL